MTPGNDFITWAVQIQALWTTSKPQQKDQAGTKSQING